MRKRKQNTKHVTVATAITPEVRAALEAAADLDSTTISHWLRKLAQERLREMGLLPPRVAAPVAVQSTGGRRTSGRRLRSPA